MDKDRTLWWDEFLRMLGKDDWRTDPEWLACLAEVRRKAKEICGQ